MKHDGIVFALLISVTLVASILASVGVLAKILIGEIEAEAQEKASERQTIERQITWPTAEDVRDACKRIAYGDEHRGLVPFICGDLIITITVPPITSDLSEDEAAEIRCEHYGRCK